MDNPKISVIVACYQPDLTKLLLTLKSILMQRECSYEIVVADDGSDENHFPEVKAFFARHAFDRYKLVASEENQGTVMNFWQGFQACRGEYIRPISPGDYLHGFYALRDWADFMDARPDIAMTFCDAIYYHFEGGEMMTSREFAHPQNTCAFRGGDCVRPYLLYDDICLGAAAMCRTKALKRYLPLLLHKVIYAEDNVYRIMTYAGERFQFYPAKSVLYEYGTGISTNGQSVWAKRLRDDWRAANEIMLDLPASREAERYQVPSFLTDRKRSRWQKRFDRWRAYPISVLFDFKQKFSPRRTPVTLDQDFVHHLLADSAE